MIGSGVCIAVLALSAPLLAQPLVPATNTLTSAGLSGPSTPGGRALPSLPTNYVGGHIRFPTNVLSFGTIKSGETIEIECLFTNTDADNPLAVRDVQAGCHCTTVLDFTKRIEPGQTGTIRLEYSSEGQPTIAVTRTVSVATSDRLQPVAQFTFVGNVWKPIDVIPPYAVFEVLPDSPSGSTSLRITNNMSELVYPLPPQSSNPQFAAEIQTNSPGREYLLVVRTVGRLAPGSYSSQFTVRTSSSNASPVTVWASARVLPPFEVKPDQILLPPGPFSRPFTTNITLQNNSTNPGVLSEPSLEVKDGTVQLRELSPGRLWLGVITVPAGFQGTSQPAALTVKTTHPLTPVIRVPIVQEPRPAGAPPSSSSPPQPAATPVSVSRPPAARNPPTLLRSEPYPAYVPVTPATAGGSGDRGSP